MTVETAEAAPTTIESSNYDIIRRRLTAQGEELRRRAEALNAQRQELFGTTRMTVVGQERIRTENNCIPQDIINVNGKLLFGYNVFIGLKTRTTVDDVFNLHRFRNGEAGIELNAVAQDSAKNFLGDERFLKDFEDLYTYYKDTRLVQLRQVDGRLLAIFQIGSSRTDVRVLRWALGSDGRVRYLDNSGQNDNVPPPSHDFEWTAAGREAHVQGRHPHVNILDTIFVETIGGDLTIKIENNTDVGLGIYREVVEDRNQALGDADIQYADLGSLILLKIRPYREPQWRYFAFNRITHDVARIDAIGHSCVQLPEDHGIIFPGGYVLTDGERRAFDGDVEGMQFAETIRSPNGEDVLFVFYRPADGRYVLLAYNLIRKEVQTPIHCHGYTVFEDGTMFVFRITGPEPTRVHPMQIWHTPFQSDEYAANQPTDGSFLARVGNAELVRGISDCLSIVRMIANQEPTVAVYETLITSIRRAFDAYFWLSEPEVGDPGEALRQIEATSELIVDEFVKVTELRRQAARALEEAEERQRAVLRDVRYHDWKELQRFIDALAALRNQRGRLITLRETRYIDRARLDTLEREIVEHFDGVSKSTVEFLLGDDALDPYRRDIEKLAARIDEVHDTVAAGELREAIDRAGEGLGILTEVVGGLQVEDPNARTRILEAISELLGLQNRARAMLGNRRRQLLEQEGRAQFAVQFQIFGQSVTGAVGMADTPERCDELSMRVLVQLEELESRFSEFDGFLEQLADKREEVIEVFENRKQALLEERQRRAHNTATAAERSLSSIARRAARMGSADELNAYFATDAMVLKVRELVERLRELGDAVRADDLATRLRTLRDESVRGLRDRLELFEDGEGVIRLGRNRFSVNTRDIELTMVARGGQMMLHITGTDFFEPVDDPDFNATRDLWEQHLVSESPAVYRAEYLAAGILFDAEAGRPGPDDEVSSVEALHERSLGDGGFGPLVRRYIERRFDEGYERGVHDADAGLILERVLGMYMTAGKLRFGPLSRALATLFWACEHVDGQIGARAEQWAQRARSFGRLRASLGHHRPLRELGRALAEHLEAFAREHAIVDADKASGVARAAGEYLVEELSVPDPHFVVSGEAVSLRDHFLEHLDRAHTQLEFFDDLERLHADVAARWELVRSWLEGYFASLDDDGAKHLRLVPEVAALLLTDATRVDGGLVYEPSSARVSAEVRGLLGQHPRIVDGVMELHLDEFLGRLRDFADVQVPRYREYRRLSHALLERERRRLRPGELVPRVLSTFVRNRLIDEVYLPMIGNNFARQLGALGDDGRSDRSGLLLIISPPGYGKTTLMEYVASRLGLVFMAISGPSLGHDVTSLDPDEAPNATARREVQKVNLALEMGNNVLLYLDDIQHTNPEFLQKFISLCDATRRIEGVWNGRPRTYDLRGKRFAVVMAGNPYTETGDRFQIPDMLANRADTHNLGDILDGRQDAFALSYVENALTSNPVLAPLATRERADLDRFLRMAAGETIPLTDMSHDYSAAEAAEIVAVLERMQRVQKTLLMVNMQYIASASQDDRYRTEPPFKLQGSYRNMARLAERVAAAMNPDELEALITDHYTGESQTLTTGAEQNLLKLAELRGVMTAEQRERWEAIKREFLRRKMIGGADDDPVARVAGPLGGLVGEMAEVRKVLARAVETK